MQHRQRLFLVLLIPALILFVGLFLASSSLTAQAQPAAPERSAAGSHPPAAPAGAVTPTPNPCGLAWRLVPSADSGASDNVLNGIAVAGSNDVWSVGYYNNVGVGADQTLIEHWTGSAWAIVSSPNAGTNSNTLAGVAAVNPNDVWAVGSFFNNTSGFLETLTEHWTGSAWAIVPSPNVAGSDTLLNAVTVVAANDVWAVGSASSGFNHQVPAASQTVILHWDGTAWTQASSPNPTGDSITLTGVSAVSSSSVFAVGYYLDTSILQFETLSLRWDGTAWAIVPTQNHGTTDDNYLNAVSMVSSTLGWAVGYYHEYSMNTVHTLIEQWDGSAWTIVPSPLAGLPTGLTLYGVAAINAGDAWAVGNNFDGTTTTTLTEHWDGSVWSIVPSPNYGPISDSLYGVAAAASNDVWAAGSYDIGSQTQNTLIERYNDPCGIVTPTSTATATALPTSTATATTAATATGTSTLVPSATVTTTASGTATPPLATATGTPTTAPGATATATTSRTMTPPLATGTPTTGPSATPTNVPIGTASPAPTTTCVVPFTDVDPYSPFYIYIRCLYCRGIVSGYDGTTFHPYANVTRGQAAKIVSNAAGFNDVVSAQTFTDVPPGDPFYVYIERLASRGLIDGYDTPGHCPTGIPCFLPANDVTRGQLAKIDANAAGYSDTPNPADPSFADVGPSDPFWVYIERLARRGIISGYDCGSGYLNPCTGLVESCDSRTRSYFRSCQPITRGQTSKVVANTFFPVNCAPGLPLHP